MNNIIISNSVEIIGEYAFYNTGLLTVKIGEGVTTISDHTFSYCRKLYDITISKSVSKIGEYVYIECINVSKDNPYYSNHENDGVIYNKNLSMIKTYPGGKFEKFYEIPKSVTVIGNASFYYCYLLPNITIPNLVITIGSLAFVGCYSLVEIIIPNSVISIGSGAFFICNQLSNIIIGENVVSLENYSFYYCTNIKNITIPKSVTTICEYAFSGCKNISCIYFYGQTAPLFVADTAFLGCETDYIMVLNEYQSDKFGELNVTKGETIEGCPPMPTLTFTQSNTYTKSCTFTNSNTLTKSNVFSLTYSSNVTYPISFTLIYTLSLTQTIVIYNSTYSNSYSISYFDSSFIYIQTEFLYYDFTIIIYLSYYSYYSNLFTIIHTNDNQISNNKIIIIIAVWVSIVIIIFISLIIILLIHIKNKKRINEFDEGNSSEEKEQENENIFAIKITNQIEEDPFAVDFKEDNIINQI